MRDFYEVLGVDRRADAQAIKKAYRAIAHRDHPDKNPGDPRAEERFKQASEAYEVLSDPAKRARYDRMGAAGVAAGGAGGVGGAGGGFSQNVSDTFHDIFGDFFGRRPASGASAGADRSMRLQVDFRTAALGGERSVNVMRRQRCDACAGTGSASGKAPPSCGTCGGSGEVRAQQGMFSVGRPCPACQGQGRRVQDPCPTCAASGEVERPMALRVRIPAGTDDGTVLRLAGDGDPGRNGGAPGDLRLQVEVAADPLFRRQGADLVCDVWLTPSEAGLGGQVSVPTLGQPVTMRIPPGVQPGRVFRLRGKGVADRARGGAPGDLLATVQVEFADRPNDRARALYLELASQHRPADFPRRTAWKRLVGDESDEKKGG